MSEKPKKQDKNRVEKEKKKVKKSSKSAKPKDEKIQQAASNAFSLLAHAQSLDPTLSSLFAVKQPPVKSKKLSAPPIVDASDDDENDDDGARDVDDVDVGIAEDDLEDSAAEASEDGEMHEEAFTAQTHRKRKRNDANDDIEGAYMQRLAREEAREANRATAERVAKRSKSGEQRSAENDAGADEASDDDGESGDSDAIAKEIESEDEIEVEVEVETGASEDEDEDGHTSPPPRHETETAADEELSKANRTVFLGNVFTDAISSKTSRKTLLHHLASFFDQVAAPKKGESKHKVESIRFRSTPYASAIPKKAAFAKKELMDATTKSTNAYAVYSSPMLTREAVKRLNGSVVLGRHLRVDQVAHPAKIDNRRCVFVGNLGFVDDESNMLKADAEEGREKRKQGKEPADIEEGLWRTFEKCGVVESVRVIRDSTTRVGKGVAYVQFTDENGVEAALLYNDKKFPPMLPRKLRVTRARAQKRNAKPGSGRPTSRPSANGYQRKVTAEEASQAGRAGKLLGRAAAARVRNPSQGASQAVGGPTKNQTNDAIKKPENFIFEGHRASARQGKTGLKLGGNSKKSKVTKRSSSFRTSKRKA